jgi:hypothetical protein
MTREQEEQARRKTYCEGGGYSRRIPDALIYREIPPSVPRAFLPPIKMVDMASIISSGPIG